VMAQMPVADRKQKWSSTVELVERSTDLELAPGLSMRVVGLSAGAGNGSRAAMADRDYGARMVRSRRSSLCYRRACGPRAQRAPRPAALGPS
jgi:hypothetical protein